MKKLLSARRILALLVVSFCFALSFNSCDKQIEEKPKNHDGYFLLFKEGAGEALFTSMKKYVENSSFRSTVESELSDSVLWESSSILETYDGRIFVQAPVIPVEKDGLYRYRLLIYQIDKEGAISRVLLNEYISESKLTSNCLDNFTGKLNIYDIKGERLASVNLKDGRKPSFRAISRLNDVVVNGTRHIKCPWCGRRSKVTEDWCDCTSLKNIDHNLHKEHLVWIESSDEDGGGGGSSPDDNGDDNDNDEIIIDKKIKDTKVECILNMLNGSSGKFKEIMSKFSGKSVIHLKFTIVPDIDSASGTMKTATTSAPKNYITTIKINQKYLDGGFSNISYARTLIHEAIHAQIYYNLMTLIKRKDYTHLKEESELELLKNNFEGLYDFYTRHFFNEIKEYIPNYDQIDDVRKKYFEQKSIDWQHELMASHYVGRMGDMLYDCFKNEFSLQQCRDFAFEGLKGTIAWNNVKNKEEINRSNANLMKNGNKDCD